MKKVAIYNHKAYSQSVVHLVICFLSEYDVYDTQCPY